MNSAILPLLVILFGAYLVGVALHFMFTIEEHSLDRSKPRPNLTTSFLWPVHLLRLLRLFLKGLSK